MAFVCAICGEIIADQDDSDEHIIPASIGGRRTVRGFLHRICNNKAGQTWDAALGRQLQPLALHFGVKRQRGQTPRMAITTLEGEDFLLGSNGQLEMAKPIIVETSTLKGTSYQVTAGSMDSAREVLNGLKRKNPNIDIEATLASSQERRSYAQGAICLEMGFGGEQAGRSLVKSALALAHEAGLLIEQCGDALGYLRGTGQPCFGYYFVGDLIANRPSAMPLHCIAIEACPDRGLILGYGEYFGVHRAVICLGRDYRGEAVRSVYALDPHTGIELDISVDLSFNESEIAAIYDYQMDDVARRQEAFGAVFAPRIQAQRASEWQRVLREAMDYAWTNCGAAPNTMLTIENKKTIVRLFANKVMSFPTYTVGQDQQSIQQRMKLLAWQILNNCTF